MKKLIVFGFLALILVSGGRTYAQGTPEVPPSLDKPITGYDGGFFIQSPDGDFKLVINGRLHSRVYFTKQTDQASDWSFRIRRVRMDFTSIISEKFEANVSFQHSTSSNKFQNLQLSNATISYTFDPVLKLTVGTVGMPLSISGETSSNAMVALEPPLVITQEDGIQAITVARSSFGNPDGLGLWAEGDIWKFFYRLAVVNGASEATGVESNYDLNPNKRVSVGVRVGYNILDPVPGMEMDLPYSEKPKLTVSVGGNYQDKRKQPDTDADNDGVAEIIGPTISRILTGGAGAAFRWRGISVNAEAFGRRTKLDDPGSTTWFETSMDDFGYYVNGGYFIISDKFEVAATGGQMFREGPDNNSYQLGGGVNWYIKGNKLKMQTGYTLTVDYDDIQGTRSNKIHYIGTQFNASF